MTETMTVDAPAVAPLSGPGVSFANIPPAGISLQLGALAIVLALLSAAEANVLPSAALGIVVPVAFGVGAVAIFTGGLMNFRAGIMVAGVIGVLYGAFWLSIGFLLQVTATPLTKAVGAHDFGHAFGFYLLLWGLISLGLCVPVAFVSKVVLAQQFILAVVFFVLSAGAYSNAHSIGFDKVGGYLGLIDALFCLYICISLTTNETAGKTVLPLP